MFSFLRKKVKTRESEIERCLKAADEMLRLSAFLSVMGPTDTKVNEVRIDLKKAMARYKLLREGLRDDYQ